MSDDGGLLIGLIVGAGLIVLGSLLIGFGWGAAHSTVARECDTLGAFYVSDRVYECKRKDNK